MGGMDLTPQEKEHWRRRLEDEERDALNILGHEMDDHAEITETAQGNADDAVAWAEREGSKDFLERLGERERNRLDAIHEAQRRLEHGEFGTCANCGEEIPRERLEILPYTTLCVRCREEAS